MHQQPHPFQNIIKNLIAHIPVLYQIAALKFSNTSKLHYLYALLLNALFLFKTVCLCFRCFLCFHDNRLSVFHPNSHCFSACYHRYLQLSAPVFKFFERIAFVLKFSGQPAFFFAGFCFIGLIFCANLVIKQGSVFCFRDFLCRFDYYCQ